MMLQKILFHFNSGGLTEEETERSVARHLLSHFGDSPGLVSLVEHLDYNTAPWRDLVLDVTNEFSLENPRKLFSMWEDFDKWFQDLITKMTSVDPAREITPRAALDIECIAGTEDYACYFSAPNQLSFLWLNRPHSIFLV